MTELDHTVVSASSSLIATASAEDFQAPVSDTIPDLNKPAVALDHGVSRMLLDLPFARPPGRMLQLLLDERQRPKHPKVLKRCLRCQKKLAAAKPSPSPRQITPAPAPVSAPAPVPVSAAAAAAAAPLLPKKLTPEESNIPREFGARRKVIFQPGGLADGVEVEYVVRGKKILGGKKKGYGILCDCCNKIVTCSEFEKHAGRSANRNPYKSIFTIDGMSLHEHCLRL